MSNIGDRPLTHEESDLLSSLFQLGISGSNQGIAKTSSTTFQNVTFGSGTGGGTWGSITGTLSNQTDLQTALNAKQVTLISGTNIKTVGGASILGSGNIAIGTFGTDNQIPFVNAGGTDFEYSSNFTFDFSSNTTTSIIKGGSANGSGGNPYIHQILKSDNSVLFAVGNLGVFIPGTLTFQDENAVYPSSRILRNSFNALDFVVEIPTDNTSHGAFNFETGAYAITTGIGAYVWYGDNTHSYGFVPTSGSAVFNGVWANWQINQTGGANGITRGFYADPVLTAVADFRAFESSNNTGYAFYGAGTAPSLFGGTVVFASTMTIGTASGTTGLINFKGTTSGTVSLSVANAAGTWTMKLPTTAGTNLYVLQTDGSGNTSWVPQSGSGGSPGGSNTYVQYNDSSAFGGDANFTWDKSGKVLQFLNGSDYIKIQPDIGSGQPGIEFFNQGIVSSKIFANNSSQLEINSDLKVDGAISTASNFFAPGLTSGGFSAVAGSLTLGALNGTPMFINFSEQGTAVWANLGVIKATGDLIYETAPGSTTGFPNGTEQFRIAQSNGLVTVKYRLSGGTSAQMNLNGLGNNGVDITYANSGIFRSAEASVYGTNDVFFQAFPGSGSGYGVMEAWSSAGLVLGTGNNTNPVILAVNRTEVARITASGLNLTGIVTNYKAVATTGYGVPAIYKSSRATAQTSAASLSAFTVGAADGSFLVSANVLVTTATLHNFTVTCTYTDEGNTSRTLTLQFSTLAGAFVTAITNAAGATAYEGVPLHIRAKAATTITIASTGTFTTVAYNIEEMITQIA